MCWIVWILEHSKWTSGASLRMQNGRLTSMRQICVQLWVQSSEFVYEISVCGSSLQNQESKVLLALKHPLTCSSFCACISFTESCSSRQGYYEHRMDKSELEVAG